MNPRPTTPFISKLTFRTHFSWISGRVLVSVFENSQHNAPYKIITLKIDNAEPEIRKCIILQTVGFQLSFISIQFLFQYFKLFDKIRKLLSSDKSNASIHVHLK